MDKGWIKVSGSMSMAVCGRQALTETELDKIRAKVFPTDRLNLVRDIFLFSCYTGLAYADVRKLRRTEIAPGVDGSFTIKKT